MERRAILLLVWCVVSLSCGAAAKQQGIEKVLDSMSSEQRHANFQDMAQVLDQHMDWVDQFYDVARTHPALMRRFLERATVDLKDPNMAKLTGELLAKQPESLEQVLVSTVDAAKTDKKARQAMNRAIEARAEAMSDVITDSPATLTAVLRGSLIVASRKPAAKESLRRAVDAESGRIVAFSASDPQLLMAITRSVLEASAKDKGSLMKILKELHVI